ncbi:hypothetical protein HCN44_003096 [Aphidius gifuensis]|uniref:Cuticular protein n=1 Tax=Aphidius gifuensis TaxID=684658 RepID=A0A835CLH5_APHGI|nr:endocuticle structural glycoprotein SgAbd-2-like [Aphidius gifuensis]KAF7987334.1 hypothetical protein HCN44_003096 [Aphidius gifuensis]
MNFFGITLVIGCAIAIANCAPVDQPIEILKNTFDGPNGDGSYSYQYETANGIKAQEQGQLAGEKSLAVQGSYSYQDENGNPIEVKYIADENGFRPEGVHLPVAPEIPAAILRSLEYIAAHPQQEKL